jgi:hypothetical protein
MIHDESPADAGVENAAPSADDAPRADAPAEAVAPSSRRRTSRHRSPRSRKTTASSSPVTAPKEETHGHGKEPALSSTPSQEPSAEGAPAPAAPSSPAHDTEQAPPAKPARSSRRRTARKTASPTPVEAVPEPEPSVVLPPSTAATAQEAASEPAPPAKPARSRRASRPSRVKKTTPEPVAAETTAPEAAAEPVEAPVTPLLETPPVTEEKIPSRGRRAARKKTAEPAEAAAAGARLVTRRGLVELHVNGVPTPPVFFFGNMEGQKEARRVVSEAQRAARAGVHLHSTLVELPCPLPVDDSVYATLDERIGTLLEADPQGYVMPRLVFLPAPGWRKQYPNEVNHYADGTTDDPSIASDRYWQEAEHALTAIIEHVQRSGYGERFIGYHLERGEWFHPVDGGYDRSYANREAFRQWLRAKYKNSEAALRAAWFDGQVQFYTAEIPPPPGPPQPDVLFFEPRRQRRWIDFLEYTSEVTADRLIALSKVVKQASGNRALVSVCYGYTFEFGHTFSGHLALGRLLAAPTVDIIAGPPSYRDRQAGAAGSLPAPVGSMNLHGKLWLSEDDTRTHLAGNTDSRDDYNPRMENRFLTEQVQLRAMARAMAQQSAIAWMDLWGEGWLDAADIWERIGTFTARYGEFIKHRRAWSPEVVVLVSERSLLHVQRGEAFVRRLLQEQRDMIQRSGASVGFYLQTDLTARSFPTDAKLYLFLNPYRMHADQRAAIKEKIQRGGKTLVWMYAVGVCDERGQPEEFAHDLIGITLRQQSWNCEIGSRLVETRHPITEGIHDKIIGTRERLNPSFYVDDDDKRVTILAEYQQTGLPSMASREFDGWRSVFCGEPALTAELFRGLCRYAGAHLFAQGGEDYVFAGDGWLALHSARDGSRPLLLPRPAALYDLNENRLLGEGLREYRTLLHARTTRCFYFGTPEEMKKLSLPGVERRRGRRQSSILEELPPIEERPVEEIAPLPEEPGDIPAAETEEAAVSTEESGETPYESGSDVSAEHKRRRRRRGGRGRGRRRGTGDTGAGDTSASSSAETLPSPE